MHDRLLIVSSSSLADFKTKEGSQNSIFLSGSIDDVLGDLLGDDDDEGPVKVRSPAAVSSRPTAALTSRSGKRSLLDDDFFSKLAEEAEKDDEGSDVSEADPAALLDSIKNMDDMDADLFGSKKKPSSAPVQRKETSKAGDKSKITEEMAPEEKKPSSAPASTARTYKKFNFLDDEGGGLEPPPPPDEGARKETPSLKTASADPPAAPSSPKTISKPVKRDEDEEDDWLAGALSRKKTQPVSQSEERETKQEVSSSLGEEVDVFVSSKSNVPSATRRRQDEPPVLNTEPRYS
ncbi:fas-binding factor 1 [Labeo rohita]|uniref:Fas-binding factor 1 n=1 Tax=Labeo rohita TaxID=84645 RepID=A0A498NXD3_LABRO|nr:fas-binding factor 1 [Labeo rohita]